ncbi:MAG: amino acid adenylation domain-containing protein, partial [Verrucomicrobia bacterium]|nr:amino acid adenylation domain-containing protein [Verrucomicrobiota bacterium]
PLDRRQPVARLAEMVADSGVRLVIGEVGGTALRGVEQIALEELRLDDQPATAPKVEVAGANLAYVIFTSGSTGRPKGSVITHAGLRNYVQWAAEFYGVAPGQIAPLHTTISFDLTVTSLWVPLAAGGSVRLVPEESDLGDAMREAGREERLRPVKLTPAHLDLLDAAGLNARRNVEVLVVGGEQLYARQAAPWVRAGARVFNEYGPTETVVGCTVREAEPADLEGGAIPIGRPLANVTNYVLDRDLNPVPAGVAGELFIGGAQVARGYLGRPDLTAERFLPDPFAADSGARMYRTGDLVRWRTDGQLEYLGRIDQQVKLRGYRIELGEIEVALSAHGDVQSCAVAIVSERLVGYVALRSGVSPAPAGLQEFLRERLPDYMVPVTFVFLPALPLTANGKVNRRGLPAPERAGGGERVGPRNATEETLAAIWREVLQVAEVGVHDNFFELGGHSLKAMQVVSRVQQRIRVKPGLRAFFQQPTIAALAEMLGTARRDEWEAIPPAPPRDHYELSHAQQRLWLLHRLGGQSAYNMPQAYVFESEVDEGALEFAFQRLVARHEALRTAFVEIDGEPRQRILPEVRFALRRIDLSGEPEAEAGARAVADEDAVAPFDLERPPLLRATLIRLAPRRSVFLFTMHHIIGDGWSGNVLYRELFALYAAARNGAIRCRPCACTTRISPSGRRRAVSPPTRPTG